MMNVNVFCLKGSIGVIIENVKTSIESICNSTNCGWVDSCSRAPNMIHN